MILCRRLSPALPESHASPEEFSMAVCLLHSAKAAVNDATVRARNTKVMVNRDGHTYPKPNTNLYLYYTNVPVEVQL